MKRIKIGKRYIGEGRPCFIIAEAGSNHNRSLRQAFKLIDIAAEAGADAVKFQTYSAENLYSRYTPRLSEMDRYDSSGIGIYDLIKSIELPRGWHKKLLARCSKKKILFLSTPFDRDAIDELEAIGVKAYKISSYEIVDLPLIKYAAKTKKPIILSTGNSTLDDIKEALDVIYRAKNKKIILLHCVSQYPAQMKDINLRAMATLRSEYGVPVGYSDHTLGTAAASAAVSLGACVIEKHFTINRKMKGPDHHFSLEPDELKRLVGDIRAVELALGSPQKKVTRAERENHRLARRSIHARFDIPKGSVITKEKVCIKRPALGIKPSYLGRVLGKRAKKKIEADRWITWDMV